MYIKVNDRMHTTFNIGVLRRGGGGGGARPPCPILKLVKVCKLEVANQQGVVNSRS